MVRPAVLCLWVMILGLTVTPGFAAKRAGGPPPAGPEQTRGGGEAQALIQQARELMKAGNFEEALPKAQQALEMREKALGPDHPGTAGSLMLVARIYDLQLNYYKALPLYQRALKIREKSLGPEHPDTAASMHWLARCYHILGYYSKALPLAQQALRIREKVLGPEHPDTAASMTSLAFLYAQMGDLNKALPLTQQALKISEKALGPEDPQTAAILENLVSFYTQMGFYDQALPLARRSAQIREKVSGPDNPRTSISLKRLGFLYLVMKDYGQAESCFRRAKHKQGDQGMVELYLATGRYEAALDLLPKIAPGPRARPQYLAQYYTQQGLALKGAGRRQEAGAAFLEAINAIEELRARTPGERTSFFETGILSGYFQAYRGMVAVLAEMAQKGEPLPPGLQAFGPDPGAAAFYFAESIKARSLLEAMAAGAGRVVSPPIPSDLAAKEQNLRERTKALEAQREEIFLSETGGPHKGKRREITDFQLKVEALQREQQQLVEELRRRVPRYAALNYPRPFKASELPLKPGEVLLEYALGEKESYLFRVEPGGKTQIFRLASGQEVLEKRLGAMLAPFRQSVLRREDLSCFSLADAAALYRELLAPALNGVAPGARLILVPDGVLGAFPFEALVVQAGADWQSSVLAGDRWPITYYQSAAILALNRHLGVSHASQPFFALGDCIYEKTSPRYLAYKAGQGQAGELSMSARRRP